MASPPLLPVDLDLENVPVACIDDPIELRPPLQPSPQPKRSRDMHKQQRETAHKTEKRSAGRGRSKGKYKQYKAVHGTRRDAPASWHDDDLRRTVTRTGVGALALLSIVVIVVAARRHFTGSKGSAQRHHVPADAMLIPKGVSGKSIDYSAPGASISSQLFAPQPMPLLSPPPMLSLPPPSPPLIPSPPPPSLSPPPPLSPRIVSQQERIAILNERFAHGRPSNTIRDAGVLVRQFEKETDNARPWNVCAKDRPWCASIADRLATTIINAETRHLYYSDADGGAGVVIAPTVKLFCACMPAQEPHGTQHHTFTADSSPTGPCKCVATQTRRTAIAWQRGVFRWEATAALAFLAAIPRASNARMSATTTSAAILLKIYAMHCKRSKIEPATKHGTMRFALMSRESPAVPAHIFWREMHRPSCWNENALKP